LLQLPRADLKPSDLMAFLKHPKTALGLLRETCLRLARELEIDFFASFWSKFLSLIEEVAFDDLNFHKIFVYAFDLRPHLYTVLESNNFMFDARLKEHCYFQGEFKDVVIHSKINMK
jgi:hypothetical protein